MRTRGRAVSEQIRVRSVADAQFAQVIDAGGHRLTVDEPADVGGTDRGPGPYALLLAALGS